MSTIRATAFAIAERIVVVEVPVEFAGQEVLVCLASDVLALMTPGTPSILIPAPAEES